MPQRVTSARDLMGGQALTAVALAMQSTTENGACSAKPAKRKGARTKEIITVLAKVMQFATALRTNIRTACLAGIAVRSNGWSVFSILAAVSAKAA